MNIKEFLIKKFGSVNALAQAIGVTASAISQWGDTPPSDRIPDLLEAATKKNIKGITLDLFYPKHRS